uniref:Uncharacterized protein n=1 Tax=Arundo donax TaxID=35708 RepID=A0A0A8YI60_ARUDO
MCQFKKNGSWLVITD